MANFTQAYDAATNACVPTTAEEFYLIDQKVPVPRIDREGQDLLQNPKLTPKEQKNYDELKKALTALLNSQPPCPGDGNIDGVVNGNDFADYDAFKTLAQGNRAGTYFNLDGLTDSNDLAVIQANLGTKCKK